MKETKAQRIYNSTIARIRCLIRNNDEHKEFYINFETKEDETVNTRTVNEIERINEREITMYQKAVQKGWLEPNELKEQAFENMCRSINAWRKREEMFKNI